jgi:hypothetical protein
VKEIEIARTVTIASSSQTILRLLLLLLLSHYNRFSSYLLTCFSSFLPNTEGLSAAKRKERDAEIMREKQQKAAAEANKK